MMFIRPILITCALTVSATAFARPARVAQLPTAPANCGTCHVSVGGGGPRNDFGVDVNATLVGGAVDWPAIFALDSDDDGFTNGEELGDPDCVWTISDGPLGTPASEPGNADSTLDTLVASDDPTAGSESGGCQAVPAPLWASLIALGALRRRRVR